MASSGMLRRVALVRTDVSEEGIASIIGVIRIGELGTTVAVTSHRSMLRRNVVPGSDLRGWHVCGPVFHTQTPLRHGNSTALSNAQKADLSD
jgi:hypothetical protein